MQRGGDRPTGNGRTRPGATPIVQPSTFIWHSHLPPEQSPYRVSSGLLAHELGHGLFLLPHDGCGLMFGFLNQPAWSPSCLSPDAILSLRNWWGLSAPSAVDRQLHPPPGVHCTTGHRDRLSNDCPPSPFFTVTGAIMRAKPVTASRSPILIRAQKRTSIDPMVQRIRGSVLMTVALVGTSIHATPGQREAPKPRDTPALSGARFLEPGNHLRWHGSQHYILTQLGVLDLGRAERGRFLFPANPSDRAFAGCDWSPDGRRLVFSTRDRQTGMEDLYITPWPVSSGASRTQLFVGGAGMPSLAPAWEPHGRRIAFVRVKPAPQTARPGGGPVAPRWPPILQLCTVEEGGRHVEVLIANGLSPASPMWSPNGRWILALAERPSTAFLVDVRRGTYRTIRLPPLPREQDPLHRFLTTEGQVAWSPDGRQIACGVRSKIASQGLRMLTPSSGRVRTLPTRRVATSHDRVDVSLSYPSWSPGGRYLIYVRMHRNTLGDDQDDLVLHDLQNDREDILYHGQALAYPTWSPDGQHVAFWETGAFGDYKGVQLLQTHSSRRRRARVMPIWELKG